MGAVLSTHRRLLGPSALSVRPIQHPSLSPLFPTVSARHVPGVPQQRGVSSALAWPGFYGASGDSQSRPPERERGAGELTGGRVKERLAACLRRQPEGGAGASDLGDG